VDVPPADEVSIFLDFSKGVIMTAGYCARCGSQVEGARCDACGYRN
jgi:hypothetical protein